MDISGKIEWYSRFANTKKQYGPVGMSLKDDLTQDSKQSMSFPIGCNA